MRSRGESGALKKTKLLTRDQIVGALVDELSPMTMFMPSGKGGLSPTGGICALSGKRISKENILRLYDGSRS